MRRPGWPKLTSILALLAVTLGAGGCIEFEKQTILMRYDRAKDVIHARLIYEGIYSGGDDIAEDFKELKKTADRGTRFYLLDNWPLDFDVGAPEGDEDDQMKNRLIRPFITVTNGTFYLDAEGRLSAWQDLEIKDAKKFFGTMNQAINLAVLAGEVRELKRADTKTGLLSKMAALGNHQWVSIDEDGVLQLQFFASDADAAKLKRNVFGSIPGEPESDDEAVAVARVAIAPKEGEKKEEEKDGEEEIEDHEEMEDHDEDGDDGNDHAEAEGDVRVEVVEVDTEITERESILRFVSANRLEWSHRGTKLTLSLVPDAQGTLKLQYWNRGKFVPNLTKPDPKKGTTPPKLPLALRKDVTTEKLVKEFD